MTTTSSVNGTTFQRSTAKTEKRGDGFLHRRVDVGEVTLHVAEARPAGIDGDPPKDVPLVVFLHGFPEFWWSWREQLRALAGAGFWAVAPDMRGYNESDKPKGVGEYEVEKLAGDIAGLIHALGRDKAIVVGHDWGGGVAWIFAQRHHDLLEKLVIMNCPHPVKMMKGFRRPKQLKKSWYMFFFQLPRIPERFIARNDYAFIRKAFEIDGFDRETIEQYVDAARVPGALTSAVNYYRAMMRRALTARIPKPQTIDRPVLVVWGERDHYLGKELAEPPKRFVPNQRVVRVPNATHWVQNDAADEVNRLLIDFVREDARR